MKKQNEALSMDGAAEKILAALDKDEPRAVKRPANRGHGATAHFARALEIPPDLAVGAGDAAIGAMQAIKQAFDAGSGGLRQNYLVQAQRNIAALDPSRHGTLVRHLQARVLALQGRGGDTRIAHVTPGELVIPERLQTPEVMGALRVAAMHAGVDPDRLEVGSDNNSINPETGEPEFADHIFHKDEQPIENFTVTALQPGTQVPPDVSLSKNMTEAANFPHLLTERWYDPQNLLTFAGKVRPGGDWDYKKLDRSKYENFGNAHYMETGTAAGIPEGVLRRAAGAVQMATAPINFAKSFDGEKLRNFQFPFNPSTFSYDAHWGTPLGGRPYGDDPEDQKAMDYVTRKSR